LQTTLFILNRKSFCLFFKLELNALTRTERFPAAGWSTTQTWTVQAYTYSWRLDAKLRRRLKQAIFVAQETGRQEHSSQWANLRDMLGGSWSSHLALK